MIVHVKRYPRYSLWIEGVPKSLSAKKKAGYVDRVKQVAGQIVPEPLRGGRLDIEIVFAARDRFLRPDVDNVAKPILDALKDVLYRDDRQVRSVRVVALPLDDAFRLSGERGALDRLFRGNEFLVNVYEGLDLGLSVSEARKTAKSE